MTPATDALREAFDGPIPAVMATTAADGMPNVAYLSQVQYVDEHHVALSYQFFNKTRQNVLANPHARLMVTHPATTTRYRLRLEYLRTETSGPLFESMKAKLAGIASQTGMSGVFRLLGSDVYRVHEVEVVPGPALPAPSRQHSLLARLRSATQRLAACTELERLLDEALRCLDTLFDIHHAMVLMLDGSGQRLYTVASHGYADSGVGSEIPLGVGVIGVAARERTPIRIGHMTSEYAYSRAMRESALQSGLVDALETEIPLPGLPASRSQMAVPICAQDRLLGVLYVESPLDLRFSYDDEDALVALAAQLGLAVRLLQGAVESGEDPPSAEAAPSPADGTPVMVRHFAGTDSVFIDGDYLIKGVAGAILRVLVSDHLRGRDSFSNRALRLDARIRLPDLDDNLEARLILLTRRLRERASPLQIEKTGRGRFRLRVTRPLQLEEDAAS